MWTLLWPHCVPRMGDPVLVTLRVTMPCGTAAKAVAGPSIATPRADPATARAPRVGIRTKPLANSLPEPATTESATADKPGSPCWSCRHRVARLRDGTVAGCRQRQHVRHSGWWAVSLVQRAPEPSCMANRPRRLLDGGDPPTTRITATGSPGGDASSGSERLRVPGGD
jgi:hypothetical protein